VFDPRFCDEQGWWQIFWGLLLFPANWIPLPAPAVDNPPGETFDFLRRSLVCFVGRVPLDANGVEIEADSVCASPGGSAADWFIVYLLFNLVRERRSNASGDRTQRLSTDWAAMLLGS
jgi:hypothetical protein